MRVLCRYYDVAELTDPVRFSEALTALPWQARREKVLRYRLDQDRRLCLGAGLLAAYALRQAGASDLTLSLLENGKPVLLHHPDIHFNLSHSGRLAVCAVSDTPVGVDVEPIGASRKEIETVCFHPQETAWMDSEPDRDLAFARLWTRKESFLKLSGAGLSVPPNTISVRPGASPPGGIVWREHIAAHHLIQVCVDREKEVSFSPWNAALEF